MIQVAIVGYGYWGQIWAKKIAAHPQFSLQSICVRPGSSTPVDGSATRYTDLSQMLKLAKPDFILLMTPVSEHLRACQEILAHKVPLFITKPVAPTLTEVERIHQWAVQAQSKVYIDHTFLYSPGYRELKTRLAGKTIRSMSSARSQWGRFQNSSNVFLELIYHDIYLALDLIGSDQVTTIVYNGTSHLPSGYVDTGALQFQIKDVAVDLQATQTSPRIFRQLDVRTGDDFFAWDFAGQIWQRQIRSGESANLALAAPVADVPTTPDALDLMLQQIHLDLSGHPANISRMDDAVKVHKILDKAFTLRS